MPIACLERLSALVTSGLAPDAAVREALPLLRQGLGASEVHLFYGDTSGFGHFSTAVECALDDTALRAVYRALTKTNEPVSFLVNGTAVRRLADSTGDYIAALIPISGMGEMVLARGPWPGGISSERQRLFRTALPTLALLLERCLDGQKAERQRTQLSALNNISRVLSESEDVETVLTSMATTVATVTAVDYVTIDLCDSNGRVTCRCFNDSRPGVTAAFKERWKQGANRPDATRDAVLRTRKPRLFADAASDKRLPEAVRAFAARTMMRSIGTVPLIARDDVVGVMTLASHHTLAFSREQIDLIEGLAVQVATAVQAIQVYRELAASKRQLQRVNEQLQESMGIQHHLARADTLTGIPNRRYIDEALEAEVARAGRYDQPLSVVMADLDNLKAVNDHFSHSHGDEALRHTARIARETCRQADMVGRYGGDEFVFVLPATRIEEAIPFGERFRRTLAATPVTNGLGESITLTVSLGVAMWEPQTMLKPSSLIDKADRAMYAAKSAGRNRTMSAHGRAA